MVDTINPQTGREDNFSANPNTQGTGPGSFYSGFNKPEDVHVNLAESSAPATPQASVAPQPIHQTYSSKNSSQGLKIFALIIGGILVVMLISTVTYFATKAFYSSKLESKNEELSRLDSELNNVGSNPVPLELPLDEELPPVEVETPVPTPPVVEEKPIEKPVEASPSITNGGQG